MTIVRVLALILVAILLPFEVCAKPTSQGHSYIISGSRLKEWFDSRERLRQGRPRDSDDIGAAYQAIGYVLGVSDSVDRSKVCVDEVEPEQQTAVVEKYLKEHPERWQFAAFSLVTDALHKTFPCP